MPDFKMLEIVVNIANGLLNLVVGLAHPFGALWRRIHPARSVEIGSIEGLRVDVTAVEKADHRQYGDVDDRTMHLRYRTETGVDETRIWPDMDYLTSLQAGGPLQPVKLPGIPFAWDWPTLDVKVVNNSGQTVTITRADFHIQQSQTILDPVPIFVDFGHHAPLKMLIVDEGWGTIESAQLRFNLLPYTESVSRNLADAINFDSPYAHGLSIQDFAHWTEVDLSAAFEDEGVDTAAVLARGLGPNIFRAGDHYRVANAGRYADMSLKEFEEIAPREFGKFKSGGALIYGEMAYAWRTSEGKSREHRIRFHNVVWLYEEYGSGTGLYPSEHYDVELEADGRNYSKTVPVSQVLKHEEADRFLIRVAVPRSSEHLFRIEFRCNGKQTLTTEPIHLRVFVPQSDAHTDEDH